MRPPKPYSCSHAVDVPAAPTEVGAFMEDAEKFLAFWASPGGRTSSSTRLMAPGTVLEYPLSLGPFTPSWIAVVSHFNPLEQIVLRSTNGPVDARTTVAWAPGPAGHESSRITLNVDGRPARRWSRFPGLLTVVTQRYLVATGTRLLETMERTTGR